MTDRARRWPLTTEIVAGKPIRVQECELIPLVRVTTRVRRRAFVGDGRVSGGGWGFVGIRPESVVWRSASGEERLRFDDQTTLRIWCLIVVAILVPCAAAILIRLTTQGTG